MKTKLKEDDSLFMLIAYGAPALIRRERNARGPALLGTAGIIKFISESEIVELSDQAMICVMLYSVSIGLPDFLSAWWRR